MMILYTSNLLQRGAPFVLLLCVAAWKDALTRLTARRDAALARF